MNNTVMIAIGFVLVIAACAAYVTLDPSSPVPEVPAEIDSVAGGGSITVVSGLPSRRIVLEAEDADDGEGAGTISAPVSVVSDAPGASGGRCCHLGPEKINEVIAKRGDAATTNYQKAYSDAPHPGFARIAFTPAESGIYRIWVRVRWSDDCGDSLDVVVDGDFKGVIQGNAGRDEPKWEWLRLGTQRMPITVRLEADKEHTIALSNREDNLWFDQILLVDAESNMIPVGILEKPKRLKVNEPEGQ